MFKNVIIKRTLKIMIFPLFDVVNKIVPKDDKIIFLYSANKGLQHNLIPLLDYLLKNEYSKKYSIVCGIESLKYAEDNKKVRYIGKFRSIFFFMKSRHVFYTTGQIPIRPNKNQIVIHLDHGTTSIKTGNLLTNIHNGNDFYFTYYTVPSELYIPIVKKEFLCGDKNIAINGEPVIDTLLTKTEPYDLMEGVKIGLWAPTFRQSDYLGYDDSSQEELLPMLKETDYRELNDVLIKNKIYLVVKLHPVQNLEGYKDLHFSNLDIYSDEDFKKNGYELYRFMKQTDFLIADYSSVFLEYLLLDKPIGFAIPDYDEYKKKRGFIFENAQLYMPGYKMFKKHDLFDFLALIGAGIDEYKEERKAICDRIHQYKDGNNCKRCLELSDIQM